MLLKQYFIIEGLWNFIVLRFEIVYRDQGDRIHFFNMGQVNVVSPPQYGLVLGPCTVTLEPVIM